MRIEPVLGLCGLIAGCVDETNRFPESEEGVSEMLAPQTAAPVASEEPPQPPQPPVEVTEAPSTPLEGPAPEIRITSPRPNGKVLRDRVMLKIALRNWELEPGGNHVHVIVDDQRYIPVYDVSRPIDLGALMQEHLGTSLSRGTHLVRLFPSRGNHESVKEDRPFAWTTFHFEERIAGFEFDDEAPLLTYSRPHGCNASSEPVLLDFYLINADLSPTGARVRWTLDRESGHFDRWTPYHIHNLTEGEHWLRLQLVDTNGAPIAGRFNEAAQRFEVRAQCPPPGAPAPDGPVPRRPGLPEGHPDPSAPPASPPIPEAGGAAPGRR